MLTVFIECATIESYDLARPISLRTTRGKIQLSGIYFQAVEQQQFEVAVDRMKCTSAAAIVF